MIRWIQLKDHRIVHRTIFRRTDIALIDLETIHYHYSAAVGCYEFLWEFCGADGTKITADLFTLGRSRLLKNLERELPGFSLQRLNELFDKGDVDDVLEVWKNVPANQAMHRLRRKVCDRSEVQAAGDR